MALKRPKKIKVIEVGPRDGLQNEKTILSVDEKVKYIEKLVLAGLKTIEATSFVRADKIPQMGDASELFSKIPDSIKNNIELPCLVPNLKGYELAKNAGVKSLAIFTATSESFNKKNINSSIDESLDKLKQVAVQASDDGIKVRGYISTVFGCPYEGKTSLETLKRVANRLLDFDVYEISFGDTIGCAHPDQVFEVISEMKKHFDLSQIAMHFHDTRGMALANVVAAFNAGISSFDSSSGGLGGCPYAKGATGNLATEDLVGLFHSMNYETGVDLKKLVEASEFILGALNKTSVSKYYWYQQSLGQ